MATEEYSGVQKAAILLIALGPEKSAAIFKQLKEEEIEELTLAIANTRSVSATVKENILNEFYQICLAQQYIAEGGINYAKELLEKSFGSEKAMDVIGKLTASLQVRPFEFIRKTDASQLLNFIQDEHPQTIALILSYLSAETGGSYCQSLFHLINRQMLPRELHRWTEHLRMLFRKWRRYWKENSHRLLIRITQLSVVLMPLLKFLILLTEELKNILWKYMEIDEPELAEEIRKKMFVFEDILVS